MKRPENQLILNLLRGRSVELPYGNAVSGKSLHPQVMKSNKRITPDL